MKIDVRRGSPVETDRAAVLTRTLRRLGLAVGISSPAGFSIAAAALVSALWIATCAVAPEFIWQGLKIFIGHATGADLLSALLIALIFVFFIEPVLGGAVASLAGGLFWGAVGGAAAGWLAALATLTGWFALEAAHLALQGWHLSWRSPAAWLARECLLPLLWFRAVTARTLRWQDAEFEARIA